MEAHQSSKLVFYLFKYILILTWLLIVLAISLSFYYPNMATLNGQPMTFDTKLIVLAFSLVLPVLTIIINRKIVIVKVDSSGFQINRKGVKTIDWVDVESVEQIALVMPPLYRLRTKSGELFYFPTKNQFAASGGIVKDLSPMGYFIKKHFRFHSSD